MRNLLARYYNPDLQRPTINQQNYVCQNLSMGHTYEHRRIFLPAFICLDSPNMAISWAKTYVAAPGAGQQASPWEHTPLLSTMCGAHETF
jgi:hypothetical protein